MILSNASSGLLLQTMLYLANQTTENVDALYEYSTNKTVSPINSTTTTTTRFLQPKLPNQKNNYKYSNKVLTTESLDIRFNQMYRMMLQTTPSINIMDESPSRKLHKNNDRIISRKKKLVSGRQTRDTSDDSAVCNAFLIGEGNKFYSPGHPKNYPNATECIRVIQAPPGYLIRLDFLDYFDMEPSDTETCEFDYLQVRDGAFGYSTDRGKFCGRSFPPMITSKGSSLWLKFKSDENIEYSGFVGIFEFLKPSTPLLEERLCRIDIGGYEGFVNRSDVPADYTEFVKENNIPLDCMWHIEVEVGWKIQLHFMKFHLIKPNECELNALEIFHEDTDSDKIKKKFCGAVADPLTSDSNVFNIRLYVEAVSMGSSFEILYTAFRVRPSTGCDEEEYDCEDEKCISSTLRCNGRNNCVFRFDEDDCHINLEDQSEHVVIIIVVFGLILGGMVLTFLVNCARKLLRDQKIIREHIRQSKESKLDEIGRASAKRSRENLSKLSPREKHSQSSLQILDDVSNRYYREVIPISVQSSRDDNASILRQQHDIVIQTSLDDPPTPERGSGTCDMGCQTRESLFQPVIRQKSLTSSSPNPSTAIRFSTFGYDDPATSNQSQSGTKHSTNKEDKSRAIATGIEMEDLKHNTDPPTRPHVCHHHHEHHSTGKGKQKMDESKVFIDIRNSAPDVIIMTSH